MCPFKTFFFKLYHNICSHTSQHSLTLNPPLSSRVEVPEREAGAAHRRARAPPRPGRRAGRHPLLPGGDGPAAPPRQPLHLRSAGNRQDGVPQPRAAGHGGTCWSTCCCILLEEEMQVVQWPESRCWRLQWHLLETLCYYRYWSNNYLNQIWIYLYIYIYIK